MVFLYKLNFRKISKLFLLAILMSGVNMAIAQTPVSNLNCGYTYGNTPSPSWNSILNGSGTSQIASGTSIDDQNYMNNQFPADFTFDFNGTLYTSFNISANGFIFFGTTDPGTITNPIANATTAYEGAIAALGGDIQAHTGSSDTPQILVQYSGTAPNRVATIEWCAFKPKGNSGGFCTALGYNNWNRYDGQIKLYENGGDNSNTIDIIHKNQSPICIDSNSLTFQVGLRGATNADYRTRSRSGNTNNTNTTEGTSNAATISLGDKTISTLIQGCVTLLEFSLPVLSVKLKSAQERVEQLCQRQTILHSAVCPTNGTAPLLTLLSRGLQVLLMPLTLEWERHLIM